MAITCPLSNRSRLCNCPQCIWSTFVPVGAVHSFLGAGTGRCLVALPSFVGSRSLSNPHPKRLSSTMARVNSSPQAMWVAFLASVISWGKGHTCLSLPVPSCPLEEVPHTTTRVACAGGVGAPCSVWHALLWPVTLHMITLHSMHSLTHHSTWEALLLVVVLYCTSTV